MILPDIEKEKQFEKEGFDIIIGVDEVGRGPLAGPVVAGACWVKPEILEKEFADRNLIRDSKKLSEKQRDKIYKFIQEDDNFILGIGEVSVETIDKINILNASLLAMRLAIDEVVDQVESQKSKVKSYNEQQGGQGVKPGLSENRYDEVVACRRQGPASAPSVNKDLNFCALIDGNKNIQNLEMEQRLFAKGDQRIFSIAAASINAKVYRDELMKEYHQKFPEYGFNKHKGYGTKFHMEQLQKNGACEIHRRSFAPVREVL